MFPGRAKLKIHKPIDTLNYSHNNIEALMSDVKEVVRDGLEDGTMRVGKWGEGGVMSIN